MNTLQDLRNIRTGYDRHVGMIRNDARSKREIAYFEANIGKITSAEDLLKDSKLYSFVMEAFGLETQIFAKALMRKVLSEGVSDEKSTANKMVDPKYREIATVLGFKESGGANLKKPDVVKSIVDRFITSRLETTHGETNPGVRLALYFERKAPTLKNWYQVLGDRALSEVVFTVLQLPRQVAMMDVDKLKDRLSRRLDLADFSNPQKLRAFIDRFATTYDASMRAAEFGSGQMASSWSSGRRPPIISIDPSITTALLKFPRF